jgi:hypothetical protein
MTSYLVYRHGSNAANQSMTPTMAVAIIDAETEDAAREVARENVNCYANQYLEFVAESELTDDQAEDWNAVSLRDAELRSFGEPSIIYTAG